jgi:Zn-finger nucleic acid-binding protein
MPAETLRCPSCGAAVSSAATRCDFCKTTLATVTCPSCFGVMFAGAPGAVGQDLQLEANIRYVPCPVCLALMNREQFAHCSHVIVDVCKPHGTWFDKDELRRAVQFIQAGGLEKARSQELEQLKDEQRRLAFARLHSTTFEPQVSSAPSSAGSDITTSAIKLLFRLLR